MTARILMVRHGRAAAGWDSDPDPGLDDTGRAQAESVAALLGTRAPLHIVTSPLLRCRETALPLAAAWGARATVDARVGEIPSPGGYSLANRVGWLRTAMEGTWADVAERSGARYLDYREAVAAAVAGLDADTVIFSHFIAINAVIGAATGDDRVVIARLDNCSVTEFAVDGRGGIALVATGGEADTLIR